MDSRSTGDTPRVAVFAWNKSIMQAVESAVRAEPRLVWTGSAVDVNSVLQMCHADLIDVLVIDAVSDPDWKLCLMVSGLFPKLSVVTLLGPTRNPVVSLWALLHGAKGIVGADTGATRLAMAIRATVKTGFFVDPGLEAPPMPTQRKSELRGKPLSPRELQVLQLIADGKTADQIGRHLTISSDTVRTHVSHILRKLDARDRAHAVSLSYRMSLLPLRPPERARAGHLALADDIG